MTTKNATPMTITVDKKISLGILWTMLVSVLGAVAYMANLNSNLLLATETLKEVKQAIERNTSQIVKSDRSLAVLDSIIIGIERRLTVVEAALKKGN